MTRLFPPLNPDGSYTLTPGSAYGPSEAAWTYEATPATAFFAPNISGSQRLPNGNTLICQGPDGLFFEVTPAGEKVWEYRWGKPVFWVDRYSPTYPGFDGTPLDQGGGGVGTLTYPIVDTGQDVFYDNAAEISTPAPGQAFYGQDAQYTRNAPSFTSAADGLTVLDNVTGLTWTKSPDWDGDGDIDTNDKFTFTEFQDYPATLNATTYGGYDDWRTPTIKELYSLMDFRGQDISGFRGTDPSGIPPFLDTDYFDVGYGDLNAGERLIDGQLWSSTEYVSTTMNGKATVFGLNIPDGRIKGYGRDFGPRGVPTHYGIFVRGNTSYGQNDFIDNGDGTITDRATGLMWQQADSGTGYNWQQALAYAEGLSLAGKEDWRLPNAKELQSILDYTRSPATHGTAAIDPLFTCSTITDEGGGTDFPSYWSSTTHANTAPTPGKQAVYLSFGTGYGFMERPPGSGRFALLDVHGAGCQRSDPKQGDPADYPTGHGPQGDVVRIFNYVRCVRDVEVNSTATTTGGGLY